MTFSPADRLADVHTSATIALAEKARRLRAEGCDVVSLTVGESDFDTSLNIKAAGIEAIHEGFTKYTAVNGTHPLREAIVEKLKRDNDLHYSPCQILVSNGAKHAISNALMALINPGDEVIIPAPYWTSYPEMVKLVGGVPVIHQTSMAEDFQLDIDKLSQQITSKTRLIFLNSPNNPTGCVYSKEHLKAIAEVLLKHPQVFILTDDIYEHIIWSEDKFHNILNVCPELMDRTMVINGVSKCYAMTGWRIGYSAGPQKWIKAMKKVQSQMTSAPNSIAQIAAQEALQGEQQSVKDMTQNYHQRYQVFTDYLKEHLPLLQCPPVSGTFYLFPNISGLLKHLGLKNDIELCEFMIERCNVVLVPGSAFGAPEHVRMSFAVNEQKLIEAVDRMAAAIAEAS